MIKDRQKWNAIRLARLERPLTYTETHVVLRHQRGKAEEHRCRHCDKPARDWAYDHEDPNEVIEESPSTHGRTVAFSLDLNHYLPLCKRCHRRLDVRPTTGQKAVETRRANKRPERPMGPEQFTQLGPDEFLTVGELSELLEITVWTAYQWNSVGSGPAYYRIGRYVRYRKTDVEDWLARRRVAS